MNVKLILPALTEAVSPYFRPIKYSLFPPLGLATLAGWLDPDDEVELCDEHVERVNLNDEPDLVGIEVYVTSAGRAYEIADHYRARGVHVCLGGLHVTAVPDEAAAHADSIFLGPGEDTWPRFLADFRARRPGRVYRWTKRCLANLPPLRRDLIKRHLYLAPNTLVVSRGCPHRCEFCYKESFFAGGSSFYTMPVDAALAQIDALPGRHLFFLDDHLFGDRRFATALFAGMRGMGRLWQAAGTVEAVLRPGLLEAASACGLRSLFVGFETLSADNLRALGKLHSHRRDYEAAVRRLHDHGVMINASFVFGLDGDDESVFDRTVEWAVSQGIETATFHILTPYPGTRVCARLGRQGRMLTNDWNLYDTRHAVFRPARMTPEALEAGYWRAYKRFYSWSSIAAAAWTKAGAAGRLRHLLYSGGWKKFEPLWRLIVKLAAVRRAIPLLEAILAGFGRYAADAAPARDESRPARLGHRTLPRAGTYEWRTGAALSAGEIRGAGATGKGAGR